MQIRTAPSVAIGAVAVLLLVLAVWITVEATAALLRGRPPLPATA
jgi:hypothetical protein